MTPEGEREEGETTHELNYLITSLLNIYDGNMYIVLKSTSSHDIEASTEAWHIAQLRALGQKGLGRDVVDESRAPLHQTVHRVELGRPLLVLVLHGRWLQGGLLLRRSRGLQPGRLLLDMSLALCGRRCEYGWRRQCGCLCPRCLEVCGGGRGRRRGRGRG